MTDVQSEEGSDTISSQAMDAVAILRTFGKAPVLPNEDLGAYETLRDSVIADIQPRGLFEFCNTRRAIDLTWEARRYQNCATALIAITYRDAVARLVRELIPDGLKGLSPDQLVAGWFADSNINLSIQTELQRFGFDEDTVMAMAVALRAAELGRLSEIRTRAEAQAVGHRREIERHREVLRRRTEMLERAPVGLVEASATADATAGDANA